MDSYGLFPYYFMIYKVWTLEVHGNSQKCVTAGLNKKQSNQRYSGISLARSVTPTSLEDHGKQLKRTIVGFLFPLVYTLFSQEHSCGGRSFIANVYDQEIPSCIYLQRVYPEMQTNDNTQEQKG